jgi:hypothetical protein
LAEIIWRDQRRHYCKLRDRKSSQYFTWSALILTGIDHVKSQVRYQVVTRRQLDFNTVNKIAEDIANFAWQKLYYLNDSQKQADMFYAVVFDIINKYAPVRRVKIKNNDKPWIAVYFKQLISRRDDAFTTGSSALYRKLRK